MIEEEESAEEPNWFARWDEDLPTPEELMPLSQTLITPDLALAFDIPLIKFNPNNNFNSNSAPPHSHPHPSSSLHHLPPTTDFDSADLGSSGGGAGGGGGDEPARTLKRPRLVWTPQLHKRFVDAVAHLGIKNAVPKTIMQLMSVDGLTRENVASHLQKYRLYLKRMQGLSSGGGSGGGSGGSISAADDQLFATGPIPHHFLRGVGGAGSGPGPGPDPFVPFVPMAALQQHHQQMAAAAAAAAAAQQQFYHQRQLGHFAGGPGFDHGFLARAQPQPQPGMQRLGLGGLQLHNVAQPSSDQDSEERAERRVLTLFPTGED